MKSADRVLPKATPDIARRVWEAQQYPSARTVARALTLGGRPTHFTTVARWKAQNWVPVRANHPLELARRQLEGVAPLATGDPQTALSDLIDDPAQKNFDKVADSEVLRTAARQVAIATTLVSRAIKARVTTSECDLLQLTLAVIAVGRAMDALPGAFLQTISLEKAESKHEMSSNIGASPDGN